METFLEILKFTIPSIIVMVGVIVLVGKMQRGESERRGYELRRLNVNVITPARMRAYERLTLFLERITPESMLGRFKISGMTNIQLQQMLVQAIRDEFEHNLSQQIYVSEELWLMVKNAREGMVQFINSCASQCEPTNDAMQLATMMLEAYKNLQDTPVELALKSVHNEFRLM